MIYTSIDKNKFSPTHNRFFSTFAPRMNAQAQRILNLEY